MHLSMLDSETLAKAEKLFDAVNAALDR